jgi:3-hydroxybutyryl-CoA dehydrogenase
MRIVVITNEDLKTELLSCLPKPSGISWVNTFDEALNINEADAFIDLLFHYDNKRIQQLSALLPKLVVVNSVTHTLKDINPLLVRINGWPTLLKSSIIEAVAPLNLHVEVEALFKVFNKTVEWMEDVPGFISARVISGIIREAIYAYNEGVSSKEDIDLAMKLGTNYPYGPFEWYERIGKNRVDELLAISNKQ